MREQLDAICSREDVEIESKSRVADVLPINNSGIDDELFSYALKAHFDFVVTDTDWLPLFAVEFDSPSHRTPVQRSRDAKKNVLCKRFEFPLLRINDNYLRPIANRMNLLTWIIESWFYKEAFYEAQLAGNIPPYEPCDPAMIVHSPGYSDPFPYNLGYDARIRLREFYNAGHCKQPSPAEMAVINSTGALRLVSIIFVSETKVIMAKTGMWKQLFSLPISGVLNDIATVDLCNHVQEYLRDGTTNHLYSLNEARKVVQSCQSHSLAFKGGPESVMETLGMSDN